MIDREQIGIRIATLRKKIGLSQQALAEKLGVSAQAVSKWEGGKNLPDIDMFRELAWLFHMTIDSIVEGDLLFAQKSSQKRLPASVEALFPDAERRRLLQSLVTYCSDAELYNIAKELSEGSLKLSVQAGIVRMEGRAFQERKVSIPASLLGEYTLQETAPYFAKALGEIVGNTDPGLRRAAELLCCPECGEKLSLENKDINKISFICKNIHRYEVTDGVVYFGSREIPGELWSLYMKNYQDYLREQCHPGNPRYQMGAVPCMNTYLILQNGKRFAMTQDMFLQRRKRFMGNCLRQKQMCSHSRMRFCSGWGSTCAYLRNSILCGKICPSYSI